MSRNYYLGLILLCAPFGRAQQDVEVETVVPAGTLLHCTLDEPNFSSQTAQVGDPVLCHVNSLEMFGRPLIPRGAYLSARLQEYRDPGHFFGKGWLQLEFTGLTLPRGSFPLNAKIISVTRYRVDREGKIKGHGHPTRDAIEWSIPVLWPIKVLTLPARGPRPVLKGETRIGLRLMEDVYLPDSKSRGLSSRSSTLRPNRDDKPANVLPSRAENVWAENKNVLTQQPASSTTIERSQASSFENRAQVSVVRLPQQPTPSATIEPSQASSFENRAQLSVVDLRQQPTPSTTIEPSQAPSFENRAQPSLVQRSPTVLALRGGIRYLGADYWVERGNLNLDYIILGGGPPENVPLSALDIAMTERINAQRGVPFLLTVRGR
jgi:hypothetical protein